MSDSRPMIFVIDDDPSIRKSLIRLIHSFDFDVEAFANPQEFLQRERFNGNSCLVLDVRMPSMSGLDLQKELLDSASQMQIVFITGFADIPSSVQAMKKGAVDFLMKPFKEEELLAAIENALLRDRNVKTETEELDEVRKRLESLTPREKEVYQQVISGKMNKEIAADMNITEATVKAHRGQVMQKMQVDSLAELVHLAEKLHLPRK